MPLGQLLRRSTSCDPVTLEAFMKLEQLERENAQLQKKLKEANQTIRLLKKRSMETIDDEYGSVCSTDTTIKICHKASSEQTSTSETSRASERRTFFWKMDSFSKEKKVNNFAQQSKTSYTKCRRGKSLIAFVALSDERTIGTIPNPDQAQRRKGMSLPLARYVQQSEAFSVAQTEASDSWCDTDSRAEV